MIVAKFGGTSLASAERFCHAANLIRQDPNRRYVVVSAPGKRDDSDIKITDQLLRYSETGDDADIGCVEARFREIAEELEIGLDISEEFDEIRHASHRREYLASRGEYFSAKLMAAFLGWPFVDAAECVFFNEYGQVDLIKTQHALFEALRKLPHAVIPGYREQPQVTMEEFASYIALAPDRQFISTDLGQALNPNPVDGMRTFITGLRKAGVKDDVLNAVTRKTPAMLLGLD